MPDAAAAFAHAQRTFQLGDEIQTLAQVSSSPVLYNSLRCQREGGGVNAPHELEHFS
jgi:hypothetical protein